MVNVTNRLAILSRVFWFGGGGSMLISGFLFWQRYTPTRLAFRLSSLDTKRLSVSTSIPTLVEIPNVGIELPVIPAKLENGRWEATRYGVSYIITSAVPGQIGNSIFYGHNWASLLGPLVRVKKGERIVVRQSNGSEMVFIVEQTSVVTPDQTHVLTQSNDRRLTIYTCTGFLDSKRFVVTAIPKE